MISKELFSEVMNIKIEDIVDLKMFGKELKYYEKCLLNFCCDGRLSKHKDSICKSINIYELAHKCKEWAWLNYGFEIFTHRIKNEINYGKVKVRVIHKHNPSSDRQALLYFDKKIFKEECESIFKACQWILDNKES